MKFEFSSDGVDKKVMLDGVDFGRCFKAEFKARVGEHDIVQLSIHPETVKYATENGDVYLKCGGVVFKVDAVGLEKNMKIGHDGSFEFEERKVSPDGGWIDVESFDDKGFKSGVLIAAKGKVRSAPPEAP